MNYFYIFILLILIIGVFVAIYFYDQQNPPGPGPNPNPPNNNPTVGNTCSTQNCQAILNGNSCPSNAAYCASNQICYCGTGATVNQACTNNFSCNLGLYCSTLQICTLPTDNTPVSTGGTCQLQSDCLIGNICDFNKTCQQSLLTEITLGGSALLFPTSFTDNNGNIGNFFFTRNTNINPLPAQYQLVFANTFNPCGPCFDFYTSGPNNTLTSADCNSASNGNVAITTGGMLFNNLASPDPVLGTFFTITASAGNKNIYFITDQYGNNLRYNQTQLQNLTTVDVGFFDTVHYSSPASMNSWSYLELIPNNSIC